MPPACAATHVDGALKGYAIASVASQGTLTQTAPYIVGRVSDSAGVCAGTLSDSVGTHFAFQVKPAPGSYGPSDNFFFATLTHLTMPSNGDLLTYATGGSVVVARAAPTLSGTFDLTFPEGRLSGCFDLAACP
jgi:hypothetical protein